MKRAVVLVGLVTLLALVSGCQYTTARLRDAADCIAASVTVGPGFMVDAQATWLARAGGGYLKGRRHALYYGKLTSGDTESNTFFIPFLMGAEITTYEVRGTGYGVFLGVPAFGVNTEVEILNPMLSAAHVGHGSDDAIIMRKYCGGYLADVGFAIHLGYLGMEFRLRLSELIDFLVGFTTVDISGDDKREEIRKALGYPP